MQTLTGKDAVMEGNHFFITFNKCKTLTGKDAVMEGNQFFFNLIKA